MHRPRYQYAIMDHTSKLIASVFTDIRSCKLPMHGATHTDMVVGPHVVRISRQEAARLLRDAHYYGNRIRKITQNYDSSEFCNRYCTN